MPGRAMGSTSRNDTAFLPKKSNRAMAIAASVPRNMASSIATNATLHEFSSASRGASVSHALVHHSVVQPAQPGQATDFCGLKLSRATTTSGR